ncbi:MAG: hypothetical protein Q9162_006067 [Coniocarpon cinnabarinum]
MPLQSDLVLDSAKFHLKNVSQDTKDFNEGLLKIGSQIPKWWEVGAQRYREMRQNGETPLPKPTHLPQAQTLKVPSRDPGRDIPCRVIKPQNGQASKGVFCHMHGGGWALQDEASQDELLEYLADTFHFTAISVGYRLAPEHPFPDGPQDCHDVAEWLVDNAERHFGCPLVVAGGEGEIMSHYQAVVLPSTTAEQRTSPSASPMYANLKALKLPPALFAVGTEDCLLDDSLLMSAKWQVAGGRGVLKIYPGGAHGFCLFPIGSKTKRQDLLALKWPSPPRNVLLLKKKHAPNVDAAFLEFLRHVQSSYPSTSVVLERDVAEQTQHQLDQPVYTQIDKQSNFRLADKIDLIVTLGGDGTILHAASLFSRSAPVPPVLSFSMGTLGFLGEWRFSEYKRAFREVFVSGADTSNEVVHQGAQAGVMRSDDEDAQNTPSSLPSSWSTVRGKFMGHGRHARILLRNRLKVAVTASGPVETETRSHVFAMNEVIIHRGSDPHLAILDVFVGGRFLTEAVADGMIISTPTGSTAYSLSSGGSIVHPLVPSLLLTPICPRSLSFRPLVLPANTPITLRLSEKNRGRQVDVSIDGVKLDEGFSVGMEINIRAEDIRDELGNWTGGVPSIVRAHAGADAGSEDSWVGGLNGLLKFNYPMGEE